MSLRDEIAEIIQRHTVALADEIMNLIGSQPVSELAGLGGGGSSAKSAARTPSLTKGGRLAKRSPEQMDEVIEQIKNALKSSKESLSSERLQELLNLDKKEIARPLLLAVERKVVQKVGEKRATKYFIAGSEASPPKAAAKKPASKPIKAKAAKKAKAKASAKPKAAKKPAKAKVEKPKVADKSDEMPLINSAPAAG